MRNEGVATHLSHGMRLFHELGRPAQFRRLRRLALRALEEYDLLFSVGADLFTMSLPSDVEPMPPNLRLIHLDIDPWEIGKNYPAEVAILGDPKVTLQDLIAVLERQMTASQKAAAAARS